MAWLKPRASADVRVANDRSNSNSAQPRILIGTRFLFALIARKEADNMGFSREYLQQCVDGRKRWAGKEAQHGDWHFDAKRQVIDVAAIDMVPGVEYKSGRFVYIPDANDLLEFIDNQVGAWGFKPEEKRLTISYEPDKRWKVSVTYGNRLTEARGASIHEALLRAVQQMIVFQPGPAVEQSGVNGRAIE